MWRRVGRPRSVSRTARRSRSIPVISRSTCLARRWSARALPARSGATIGASLSSASIARSTPPVPYRAGSDADQAGYVHIGGPSLDDLAETIAHARAGLLPKRPMIGAINEALIDPSRAPPGKGLMKFVVHFVRIASPGMRAHPRYPLGDIKESYATR